MGVESEHQPTEKEQEIINAQMPEGSVKRSASEWREEKHQRLNGYSGEAIRQLASFDYEEIGNAINFRGELNGHQVEVFQSGMGKIDGMDLSKDDAEELWGAASAAKHLEASDATEIEGIKKEDSRDDAHTLLMEALGKKE